MTSENNRAPLWSYIKLCALYQIHQWIQTEVTDRKHSIQVQIGDFFILCDFEIWQMTLKNNRAHLLCYFKLRVLSHNHRSIQTGDTVWKCPNWVNIGDFFVPCDLEIWKMTLNNNRAPLLYYSKLCASFHSHRSSVNSNWSYSPETSNSGANRQFFVPPVWP